MSNGSALTLRNAATLLIASVVASACNTQPGNPGSVKNTNKNLHASEDTREVVCISRTAGIPHVTPYSFGYDLRRKKMYLRADLKPKEDWLYEGILVANDSEIGKKFTALQEKEENKITLGQIRVSTRFTFKGDNIISTTSTWTRGQGQKGKPDLKDIRTFNTSTLEVSDNRVIGTNTLKSTIDCVNFNYPFKRSPQSFARHLEEYLNEKDPNVTHTVSNLGNCKDLANNPFSRKFVCSSGDLSMRSALGVQKCLIKGAVHLMYIYGNTTNRDMIYSDQLRKPYQRKPEGSTQLTNKVCRWQS